MITSSEIEAVARAACKEMGLDADEVIHFVGANGWDAAPRWERFDDRAAQAIAFHRAIEAVKGAGK